MSDDSSSSSDSADSSDSSSSYGSGSTWSTVGSVMSESEATAALGPGGVYGSQAGYQSGWNAPGHTSASVPAQSTSWIQQNWPTIQKYIGPALGIAGMVNPSAAAVASVYGFLSNPRNAVVGNVGGAVGAGVGSALGPLGAAAGSYLGSSLAKDAASSAEKNYGQVGGMSTGSGSSTTASGADPDYWALLAALGSGALQSSSVNDANSIQNAATNTAIGENRRQFDLTRGDYAPYRAAGTQALGQLQTEIGRMPTAAEVMAQPGYQFGMQQGQLGLDRKAAAAGGRVSGAALKAASQYATDYATTGYNAEYQRRQDRLNRLQALAGIGQTATIGTAQAGQASTGAISGLVSSQGNASGAASMAQGNIWGNAINQLGAVGSKWANTPNPTASANTGPSNAELEQMYGFG